MSTTIKSSALDFNNIKSNLKNYLAAKDEYRDYNFEASGLSNLLDVLAYNTHLNALIANFTLNESFLTTAQLRSSVVSLAEGIGYAAATTKSSRATVKISFKNTTAGRSTKVTLPAYTKFTANVNDVSYTFQTIEPYYAVDDGTGYYEFQTENITSSLTIYEGALKTKTFYVGEYADNPVYVIPDKNLDSTTVTIKVYDSPTTNDYVTFESIYDAVTVSSQSRVYILKEAPNGFYELTFGDGVAFGQTPTAGARIVVEYLSTKGAAANGASLFTHVGPFQDGNITVNTLTTVTLGNSTGGEEKESTSSIKNNAPFYYAAQNRMVTADDYSSLIKKKYGVYIDDIQAWGGQDNAVQEYGAVYVSIVFKDDVSGATQAQVKQAVLEIAQQLAIVSFKLRFADPTTTYIETTTTFDFNPNLTTLTRNTVEEGVESVIQNYFDENTGKFKQSFRQSQVLTKIDEFSNAVLSSKMDVRMQQRFVPSTPSLTKLILDLTNYTIPDVQLNEAISLVNQQRYNDAAKLVVKYAEGYSYTAIRTSLSSENLTTHALIHFPVSIAEPDDVNYIITSSPFTYKNKLCVIRNRLKSNTLQIISTFNNGVIKDGIGSFLPATGIVRLNYFEPTAITGGVEYIKIAAVPANQSSVEPRRNHIVTYDPDRSVIISKITTATI